MLIRGAPPPSQSLSSAPLNSKPRASKQKQPTAPCLLLAVNCYPPQRAVKFPPDSLARPVCWWESASLLAGWCWGDGGAFAWSCESHLLGSRDPSPRGEGCHSCLGCWTGKYTLSESSPEHMNQVWIFLMDSDDGRTPFQTYKIKGMVQWRLTE